VSFLWYSYKPCSLHNFWVSTIVF